MYRSLRGTLRDAIAAPLRTALAAAEGDADNINGGAIGSPWYGQLVAACQDPGNPGALLSLYDDRAGQRVLVVVNGTPEPDGHRRRYGINIPAAIGDPVAAAGWTYGLTAVQYSSLVRRT